jgi:DNA-binding CsgD family transcriptional regulator
MSRRRNVVAALGRVRFLIEPLGGLACFAAWLMLSAPPVIDYVQVRDDLTVTNPYGVALAVFFAVALAFTRLSPGVSIGLVSLALTIQFVGWAGRFSDTGWTAYGMHIPIALALSVHATGRIRRLAVVLALPVSLVISALLNVPALSSSGAQGLINGRSTLDDDAFAGLAIWAFVALLLGAMMWWLPEWLRGLRTSPDVARPEADASVALDALSALSSRERDIYLWVARGMTNAEIAAVAHIEESTVKSHISRILAKLDLSSRTAVIAHAYRWGVLTPELDFAATRGSSRPA